MTNVFIKITCKLTSNDLIHVVFFMGDCDGVVVEHLTPNREVLGSMPNGGTVLCP